MDKRFSTIWRFLLPIVILLIIAPIVFLKYLTLQQQQNVELSIKDDAESLVHTLSIVDQLIAEDVDLALGLFKSQLLSLGHPHINGTTISNGKTLPNLMFGSQVLTNQHTLIKQATGHQHIRASVFVLDTNGISRVASDFKGYNQHRVVADLSSNSEVVRSVLSGQSITCLEEINHHLYIVKYEPIFNQELETIGAYSVAHPVETDALINAINQHTILDKSLVIVSDNQKKVLIHSKNYSSEKAQALLNTAPDGWQLVKASINKWNIDVNILYQESEASSVSFGNVLSLMLAGTLLGLALIFIILYQLKRLILDPIGADPDVVIQVMQKISSGNLEDDKLHAQPETLLANVLNMRTTLKKSFAQLQDNAKRMSLSASVFANAHDGIFIASSDFRIVEVNASFTKITGYTRQAVIHHKPVDLGFSFQDADYFNKAIEDIRENDNCRGEVWNLHSDGDVYAAWLDIFAVYDEEGAVVNYVGLFSDITDVKNQQKELEHMAYHDPLTQLPNRTLFSEQLNKELNANNVAKDELLAICYFDLDGFKPVNDELGHEAGDKLLVGISNRVQNRLRDSDTIARLGGDEFALLLSGLSSKEDCVKKLDELLEVIKQPFDISGEEVFVSASIGYTLYPEDYSEPDTLLRHADHAMYYVKVNGRGFHHQFDSEASKQSFDLQKERDAINAALPNGEFNLYYQPKVDMQSGTVVGAEALIRWYHPDKGVISPAEFLPMIEQDSEFTVQIGEWVISETLRQINTWSSQGVDLKVSVNISAKHIIQSNFSKRLRELLMEYPEVPPALLDLEITETSAVEDVAPIVESISKCKLMGVSFSLDDFGVGNSSLTYLRKIPVEAIKIDQSFIRDMLEDDDDLAVVSGVISLSKSFGLGVIAEGVETEAHGVKLLEMGCTIAQGYGISKPLQAEQVVAWVESYQTFESWRSNEVVKELTA